MIHRRFFLMGAAALAGCGSGGMLPSENKVVADPSPPPLPPPPTPSTDGPKPKGNWYLEGDSYMIGGMAMALRDRLGTDLTVGAVGGSDMVTIRNRIMGENATLRTDPLIIWDGAMNGHFPGSVENEMKILGQIVEFRSGRKNWLLVLPIPVNYDPSTPMADTTIEDIAMLKEAITKTYGAKHVFDPLPEIQFWADGGPMDAADVKAGRPPRSTLADGIHLTDQVKQAVATKLTSLGGPMLSVAA